MRRKFLSVVLCVCMMLTMAPFAFAAGNDTSTESTQEQSNSSGSGSGSPTTSVTLPSGNSGNLTISTDNAVLDGSVDGSSNLTYTNGIITVNADNVTIKNLVFGDNAKLVVNTTRKFTLTGCTFAPTQVYNKATDTPVRTAVTLNVGEAVVTNNTFNGVASGYYNAIEFGIGTSNNDLSEATITGNTFNSPIQNNYFNFYNMTTGAVIDIKENQFLLANKGSNAIRISNYRNVTGVTFNIDNNKYTYASDSSESQYEGLILLQDFSVENAGTQNFSGITLNITRLDSPSSAKQLLYVYDDQDGIISYNQPAVTGDSSIEKFAVAKVGDFYSPSLASAVAAATNGQTITLLKDTALTSSISIEKNITLDLGGKTLSRDGGMLLDIYGDVTIQNGTVAMTNTTRSGADIWVNQTAKLTVEKSATISAPSNSFAIAYYQDCTAAEVTLKGTLTGEGSGITVNGNIKDKDSSNQNTSNTLILDGTTINVKGHGVYQAGYATTTFTENASTITGSTGIEVRAGNLTVTNSTITGNGTFKCAGNGDGTTTDGVGIAIAQHTTKLPINVTISGGTISGKYAVYESNPQANDPTSIGQVKLSITGGNFNGSTAAVYSQDVKDFITGGLFTTDPTAYCGTKDSKKLTGIPSGNSSYPFTISKINAAVKVAEGNSDAKNAPNNSTFDNSLTKEAVKQVASSATASLSGASGEVAKGINETTIANATTKLGSLVTDNKTVVVLVQPYLEITPTGSSIIENNIKSISLNIEPKYNLIATTSDVVVSDPSNIKTDGVDKNADLMESAKPLTVTTPTPVTVTLPTGFANAGNSVYIKHEASNGKIYYYTAIVGEDYKITFTTKNGFSPFTISTTSEAVAEVDGIGYATFQDAVDAVENGGTIKALKNIDSTVSGNKTFTVNTNSNTVTLTAASGYNLTKNNNVYTVSRQHSGSSSSGTTTTYAVNVNAATNGAVAADKKTASKGTTVTVTASPSKGYVVDAVKVVDKDGKDVAVTGKDGKYVFTMPGSAVTVTGTFKAETPAPVALPFTDVKSGNWFYDAVKYAYEQGLMTGTSATTFAPNGTMNRAMIVTVLYRLEKSPAVTGASKFTDVPAGQWYSDAVAWAAANKIVNGYDETTFGPMNAVTREQMAAILFRYEQVKGLENVTLEENLNRFPDQNKISAYAIPALQWAVGQKIINGNADGTLDPTGTATRAQVAQIFTNLLNK